jgi:C-terminal processing protease CtpA/Prc
VKTQKIYDVGSVDIWKLEHEEQEEVRSLLQQRWVNQGNVMIWKMPDFFFAGGDLKRIMAEAPKHSALILDLRSNPGGSEEALTDLLGYFFDHDVTVCTRRTRYESKPLVAKSHGHDLFTGKLVVLVDSESASSAELFARTIQLQHRGIVVGDRTAGQVMEAQIHPRATGAGLITSFAVSITHASVTMPDGQSLESVGVTPDVVVIPTTADIAAGRDAALSRAAELAGIQLDAAAAGKLFPFEWAPLQ